MKVRSKLRKILSLFVTLAMIAGMFTFAPVTATATTKACATIFDLAEHLASKSVGASIPQNGERIGLTHAVAEVTATVQDNSGTKMISVNRTAANATRGLLLRDVDFKAGDILTITGRLNTGTGITMRLQSEADTTYMPPGVTTAAGADFTLTYTVTTEHAARTNKALRILPHNSTVAATFDVYTITVVRPDGCGTCAECGACPIHDVPLVPQQVWALDMSRIPTGLTEQGGGFREFGAADYRPGVRIDSTNAGEFFTVQASNVIRWSSDNRWSRMDIKTGGNGTANGGNTFTGQIAAQSFNPVANREYIVSFTATLVAGPAGGGIVQIQPNRVSSDGSGPALQTPLTVVGQPVSISHKWTQGAGDNGGNLNIMLHNAVGLVVDISNLRIYEMVAPEYKEVWALDYGRMTDEGSQRGNITWEGIAGHDAMRALGAPSNAYRPGIRRQTGDENRLLFTNGASHFTWEVRAGVDLNLSGDTTSAAYNAAEAFVPVVGKEYKAEFSAWGTGAIRVRHVARGNNTDQTTVDLTGTPQNVSHTWTHVTASYLLNINAGGSATAPITANIAGLKVFEKQICTCDPPVPVDGMNPLAPIGVTPNGSGVYEVGLFNTFDIAAATVTPSDADNKNVTWASSAPAVARVDANAAGVATVLGLTPGTATITATSVGNNTISQSIEVEVLPLGERQVMVEWNAGGAALHSSATGRGADVSYVFPTCSCVAGPSYMAGAPPHNFSTAETFGNASSSVQQRMGCVMVLKDFGWDETDFVAANGAKLLIDFGTFHASEARGFFIWSDLVTEPHPSVINNTAFPGVRHSGMIQNATRHVVVDIPGSMIFHEGKFATELYIMGYGTSTTMRPYLGCATLDPPPAGVSADNHSNNRFRKDITDAVTRVRLVADGVLEGEYVCICVAPQAPAGTNIAAIPVDKPPNQIWGNPQQKGWRNNVFEDPTGGRGLRYLVLEFETPATDFEIIMQSGGGDGITPWASRAIRRNGGQTRYVINLDTDWPAGSGYSSAILNHAIFDFIIESSPDWSNNDVEWENFVANISNAYFTNNHVLPTLTATPVTTTGVGTNINVNTIGINNLKLSYSYTSSGVDTVRMQYSVDGGITWINMRDTISLIDTKSRPSGTHTIILPADTCNRRSLRIRWVPHGDARGWNSWGSANFSVSNINLVSGLQLGERPPASSSVVMVTPGTMPTTVAQREAVTATPPTVTLRAGSPASTGIAWTSSNTDVARVIDGRIRGLNEGRTTIRAAAIADPTVYIEFPISVTGVETPFNPLRNYTITSPYAGVDWDNWGQYKAALHVHSWVSDGYNSTAQMAQRYYDLGFNIIAFTDHDRLVTGAPWTNSSQGSNGSPMNRDNVAPSQTMVEAMRDGTAYNVTIPHGASISPNTGSNNVTQFSSDARSGAGMIILPGTNEESITLDMMLHNPTGHHVNTFWASIARTGSAETINSFLGRLAGAAAVNGLGGLARINHPGRYTGSQYSTPWDEAVAINNNSAMFMPYVDLFNARSNLIGMEIINKFDTESQADRILWDNILSQTMAQASPRPVWGFSDDDAHSAEAAGYSYNIMLMSALTEAEVHRAMLQGSFLAFSRVDREYGIYPGAIETWDWDGGWRDSGNPHGRIAPVRDLPVPVVKSIEVSGNRITIEADNYCYIDWYADGLKIHTGDTLSLRQHQLGIYSYVRATIVSETYGVIYTQPFGVTDAAPCTLDGSGDCSSSCDDCTFVCIGAHAPGAPATCTTEQRCTLCPFIIAEAKGHRDGTPPTCTVAQTCPDCDIEQEPALGHDLPASWTVSIAPTCTQAGLETKECSRCDYEETQVISLLGHNPGTPVTINATCLTDGSEKVNCTRANCGEEIEFELIPALGHDWTAWGDDPEGTPNVDLIRTCERPGCDAEEKQTIDGGNPACVHDFTGSGVVTKAATCNEEGEEEVSCATGGGCGATITQSIPRTAHTPSAPLTDAATCTNDGRDYTKCTECEVVLTSTVIPAHGHTPFSDWDGLIPPTCTAFGKLTKSCITCGEAAESQMVDPTGVHVFGSWFVRSGVEVRICIYENCTVEQTRQISTTVGGGGGGGGTATITVSAIAEPGAALVLPAGFTISQEAADTVRGPALLPAAAVRATGAGNHTVNFGTDADVAGQNAILIRIVDGKVEVVSTAVIGNNGRATINVPAAGDYLVLARKTGDITGTGEVDTGDALMLLMHIANLVTLDPIQQFVSNGKTAAADTSDVMQILRLIAGLIDKI
jgi:hypothetical protein